MKTLVIWLILIVPLASGCYRTQYVNLTQPGRTAAETTTRPVPASRWQHFWVYGWIPGERVIPAAAKCGGAENIRAIETQRTFAEGLVAAFAGYYINIYSPYNGEVICKRAKRQL